MHIKTNLNRLNKIHDNVNYVPIEQQVHNYIRSTGLFKTIKYIIKGNYTGFILNEQSVIELRFDNYRLSLEFSGDRFKFSQRTGNFHSFKYELTFNDNGVQTSNWHVEQFLELVEKITAANAKAKELIKEFPETKESSNKISREINKYFDSKLIKARYDVFESNVIAQDNSITKGIWSWLCFELKGITNSHNNNRDHVVMVELYMDGSIKKPRIEEMVGLIGEKNSVSLKVMQERLDAIKDFEVKVKAFDGTKIPVLQDFLALQKRGLKLRKEIGVI